MGLFGVLLLLGGGWDFMVILGFFRLFFLGWFYVISSESVDTSYFKK